MDKETLKKMKNGDAESFRAVIVESQRPLFSFILKYVADEEAARDLLQETFIRIWQNRWRYNSDKSFMTWALAIAVNLCKDFWRKNKKKLATEEDEAILLNRIMSDTDLDKDLSNREWVSVIRALVSEIGGKQRIVFTLNCLEGYENEEIQLITGLSLKQIKSNLYAAKQTIKKKLEEMGYE